jgi:transposase
MAETATEVSTIGLVDTMQSPGRAKRRQWTAAFKRQIVAETLAPGASVSIVARRHDVNTNQVFKWRRAMAAEVSPAEPSVTLLPVAIAPEVGEPRSRARRSGTIEITFSSGARVCARRGFARDAAAGDRAVAMIGLPAGTRVWLAAGVTDMRNYAERTIMRSERLCGARGDDATVSAGSGRNHFT